MEQQQASNSWWRTARRNLLEKPEERDKSLVGITFVDVLFAIVVAQILEPVARGFALPAAGKAQLGVALVLTITSWIGYHNSWNRPRFFIRFLNWPLAQFTIDVMLVGIYWLSATWVEGLPLETKSASALPETSFVAISFLLYLLWDGVGYKIRQSDRYFHRPLGRDVPARRQVSGFFVVLSSFTLALVYATAPITTKVVLGIDAWLIAMLLTFRIAKEAVTTPEDRELAREEES